MMSTMPRMSKIVNRMKTGAVAGQPLLIKNGKLTVYGNLKKIHNLCDDTRYIKSLKTKKRIYKQGENYKIDAYEIGGFEKLSKNDFSNVFNIINNRMAMKSNQ